MKKAEAISILATSVRPREAKDRARYDEAVKMAIEALKSSEQTAESAQNASSCARENDVIFRQAAIDALKGLPTWWADEGGYYGGAQPPMVALLDPEDAVSAIENLPSAQPATNCSEIPNSSDDTISRQAALKKLAVYIHLIDKTMGKGFLTDDDCMEAAKSVLGEDELPAVQPVNMVDAHAKNTPNSTSLGEKEGKPDLISRQTALDALARMMPRSYTPDGSHPADEEIFRVQEVFADCIEALEILPSAQPEIIRCKDCDWWTKQKDSLQGRCELMQMYPAGGWYCGNARRRGGDSD